MAQKIMDDFMGSKTRLKEFADNNGYETPVYETVSKRTDDFRKIYKVRVIIEGLVDTTGEGYSRRLAEYRAAINAFNEIQEVREEQQKSKDEQLLAKEAKNVFNKVESHNNEEVSNDSTGVRPVSKEGSAQQLNAIHNESEDNINDNDVNNHQNNSIIINADINTSAEEVEEPQQQQNEKLVNGGINSNDSQSQDSSITNGMNGSNEKDDNSEEKAENSQTIKMNGKRNDFMNATTLRTFQPLVKSPVQQLQDFCMEKQSAYPFYDTTYKDRTFLIKCRIEFNEDQEKREFFGTGTGYTSKEAKLMAAEDIIQQLTALSFV